MWTAVIIKEFVSRLQGRLSYALLTVMVASFTALTLGAFWLIVSTVPTIVPVIGSSVGSGATTTFPSLVVGYRGIFLFFAMGVSLLMALIVVAPAVAGSAISAEREEATFDLLITSGASARSIVLGKIVAAALFVSLLALTSIPGFTIAWYYGGVAWAEVLPTLVLVAATAWFFACLGVFSSSVSRSSVLAALYAYCGVFLVTLGSLALYLIGASLQIEPNVRPLLVFNPFASLLTVPDQIAAQVAQTLPFQYRALLDQPGFDLGTTGLRVPRWVFTAVVYVTAGLALAALSAMIIDPCDRLKARLIPRPATTGDGR